MQDQALLGFSRESNVGFVVAVRGLDTGLQFFVSIEIFYRNEQGTVGVYVKVYFDLEEAVWCGRNTLQEKAADGAVLVCQLTLALKNMNRCLGPAIRCHGEFLAFSAGDRGEARNYCYAHSIDGFYTERVWRGVEEQDAFDIALEDATENGGADRDRLVGINSLRGLLAEKISNYLLNFGNACRSTAENHLVDLGHGEFSVGEDLGTDCHGAVEKVVDHALES